MKKKIITIIAILLISVTALCTLVACNSKINGTNIEYELDEATGEIHITSYSDSTLVTKITIPDEIDGHPVTVVDDFGVVNAETLTTIEIGKNVKEIGTWAFTNNRALKEFVVSPENPYFCSVDGVLFTKDMKTLLFYPVSKGASVNKKLEVEAYAAYDIPYGVETIRAKAFYKCIYLRDVTIPETVTAIEEKAFHRCDQLNSVAIPSNLQTLGKDAFAYCEYEGFTTVTLPASLQNVGEYAYYNCRSLMSVTVLKPQAETSSWGKKWYPTDNGRTLKGLEVKYID